MTRMIKVAGIVLSLCTLIMAHCGARISQDDIRFARIRIDTARSHFMNGDFAQAESDVRKALEFLPDDPEANRLLALAAFKQRKLAVALQYIRKAIEIDPKCGEYRNDLGGFYQFDGKHEQALIEFNLALEDKGYRAPAATFYNIADSYRAMHNLDRAMHYYKKSLEIDPNQDRPYYQLGLMAKDNNDMEQAIHYFEEGFKVNQKNFLILQELCLYSCSNRSEQGTKRYCTLFLQNIPPDFDDPYAIDRAKRCLYDFE
ncbi:tetratricopeptide repeat protein [bacterium]|nr:tetratricopeptide repeat protein [bacterium]